MTAVPLSGWFDAPRSARRFLAMLTTLAAFAIWLTAAIADPAQPTDTGDIALPKGVHIDRLILPDGAAGPASVGFGVNSDGLPVVADGTQLRVPGESQPILDIAPRNIDDFSWMLGSQLLLISGDRLISPGPNGQLRELALSEAGMKVRRAGNEDAYVFGSAAEPANHDVFLLKPSGTMIKLATLASPILDVSGSGTSCYVAIGRRLLHIAEGETVAIVLEAPADITSIMAVDNGGVFFATKDGVSYANPRGSMFTFLPGFTGILRADARSLFVWNATEHRLLRIQDIGILEEALNKP